MINRFKPFLAMSLLLLVSLVYTSAQAAEKPRVAVKEPIIGEGIGTSTAAQVNLEKLLAEMEASLLATRKFEVLSRDQSKLAAIREEQNFASSSLTKGNAAEQGGIENANYLVIPTVTDFVFYRSTKPVPNLRDKYVRTDSGRLEIDAQIIDTVTGAIKTTFYMKSTFATKDEVVNTKGGSPSTVHFTKMAKSVSAQLADQLVDAVFPMRVLNVQNNQVWINRGQDGGLDTGDILNVYHPGVALIDPDTGDNLGSAEAFAGKIKVTRVNPKFTITEVVEDQSGSPIAKGDIVRKP
ncbi:FlgT C-terminal domain-containing protein [Pseudomonadota bacterium]